jgi:hypothetical protein
MIALPMVLASCASVSRLHPYKVPANSLRLTEVVYLGSREEIVAARTTYQTLLASGIQDSDLQNGSLAAGRVYCCGHPNEVDMTIFFYVPATWPVHVGDLVEVRMGSEPDTRDSGAVNTAVRVRQTRDATERVCQWIPPNPRLWMRILYCDWMQTEGWVEQTGLFKTWYKPGQ